ncbi:hypothetical protein ACTJJ0_30845 [Chitinophaga sp. 22321]|uniref:Phage tail assembly chaperone protein, E, or 41 or 14 n=1 Tax=Chitinophaga hostae TaxID=2831022 RepID=A0ABS5J8U8_9BACT|nr:hypothetical protein [Chitinophaga hostae]MBS0031605.1 hypothetical protein [Chitinophaga hostae]
MNEIKNEQRMPQKSVTVKIGNNDYTISYPNTGQMIDIDILKSQFSSGNYEKLKYSYDSGFVRSAVTIDAVAIFNVMLPQLRDDLTVKSLFALDREKMDVILNEYVAKVVPWMEEWESILKKPLDK